MLLAALLANLFLPVPTSASDTTKALRSGAPALLSSALVALFAFLFQAQRSRWDRRRGAYAVLLKAAERLEALVLELSSHPTGREYVGTISPTNSDEYLRHDSFAESRAIEDEMHRLFVEAEVGLILDEGLKEPALVQWWKTRTAYMRWRTRLWAKTDPELMGPVDEGKLKSEEQAIRANIHQLRQVCHERTRGTF